MGRLCPPMRLLITLKGARVRELHGICLCIPGLQIRLIFTTLLTGRLAGGSWHGLVWRMACLLVVSMSLGCGYVAGRASH